MNSSNTKIRLLVVNDAQSETERLISMLENSGRQCRPQHVESEEALTKLLQEQSWDLLIAYNNAEKVTPDMAIKQIRRIGRDLPVIILTDQSDTKTIVNGIKLGATDVITIDEDQHLLQVINRELSNREMRGRSRSAERSFKEIKRRNQQLLNSSKNGIAFIQDGMFIYANESLALFLGYDDPDDLDCMPVIDSVTEKDQDRIKTLLKDLMIKSNELDTQSIEFDMIDSTGATKAISANINKTTYEDDEVCLQLTVSAADMISQSGDNTAAIQVKPKSDKPRTDTNGQLRLSFFEKLETAVDAAVRTEQSGALFYIGVNNLFAVAQAKLGTSGIDAASKLVNEFINSKKQAGDLVSRFRDDAFMLLIPRIDIDSATERAEQLCQALSDHIIDYHGATIQFTYNIGISLLNETTSNSEILITHAMKALNIAKEKQAQGEDIAVYLFEPEPEKNKDGSLADSEIAKIVNRALEKSHFHLLYQPILSLRGEEKEHYQVTLKIREKDETLNAMDFLHVAEQIKLATKIDRWVILEAFKALARHRKDGHDTCMFVSLTSASLMDKSLFAWLKVAIKAAKIPANSIIFQFQESSINDHLNVAKEFASQVNQIGCGICISHFGCGLNPVKILEHVDAKFIKLDSSFTQELQESGSEATGFQELVEQIHEHDKKSIVSYVENASILSRLWQNGVHFIQGQYLQAPSEMMNYNFQSES